MVAAKLKPGNPLLVTMFQLVDLHELLTDSTKEERLLLLFIAVSCDDIRLARQIIERGHAGI